MPRNPFLSRLEHPDGEMPLRQTDSKGALGRTRAFSREEEQRARRVPRVCLHAYARALEHTRPLAFGSQALRPAGPSYARKGN